MIEKALSQIGMRKNDEKMYLGFFVLGRIVIRKSQARDFNSILIQFDFEKQNKKAKHFGTFF